MPEPDQIYFDFVDPLSYVAFRASSPERAEEDAASVEWVGFELRPPPTELLASDAPFWVHRLKVALSLAEPLGLLLAPPSLIPWSRKAHELYLHTAPDCVTDRVLSAIFDAFFQEGRDIGRIDVLVDIAASAGFDRTETKAVLDVDRHEETILGSRRRALEAGVTDVPCRVAGGRVVEGFPDLTDLGTFLPHD